MSFIDCVNNRNSILMEGALGERLKREYRLVLDEDVVMAGLVYSDNGRRALKELWSEYAKIAGIYHLPFLATTPTRRTNQERVGRSKFDSTLINENVKFLREVQEVQDVEMYIGGLVGCKGDAFTGEDALDLESSKDFHEWEVRLFAEAGVDFLYAALFPNVEEAAGMALAIEKYKIPYIISFTIKKDGCLIDGTRISDAIKYIDSLTANKPVCYMTNCVHPRIVYEALLQPFNNNEMVHNRFKGIQVNTSALSYAELDNSKDLKVAEPTEIAVDTVKLREISPFQIFGGCCGTDGRHMSEIAKRI
ncbi:MAG: homocysteine S-methyltransferase family protein [Sedimentibacter saalensis]|uniref:homocysteine S-methyltransferase family protein n=1 Tax=Sedimentibacter saalensis TaxID=130788 RepID=UPI003158FD1D